jgi:hypothetical protein
MTFSVPEDKEILKRRHFDDIGNIRSNTTAALKAIPQNQFENCFEGWTRHWHRCIASQGEYFEGNEVCSTFIAMSSRTLLSVHLYRLHAVSYLIDLFFIKFSVSNMPIIILI